MKRRIALLSFVTLALAAGLPAQKAAAPPPGFSYHSPAAVASALDALAARYPRLVKVMSLGRSAGGTDIPVAQIAALGPGASDPARRPAVFVSANLEGLHLVGTEAALTLAEKLLSGYGKDKAVTALLDGRTVYLAPLLNPDAAQAYFAPVRYERSANGRAVDDDADGVLDEDGYEDLNHDGLITQMRVKDPEGAWIVDPKDPRLMRQADPLKGEKGVYALYTEGIDNDGDGKINEDPPGGVELNRNFAHDFEYNTKAAGLWPVSEPETRSLAEFLFGHANIGLILNFSTENTFLNMQQTGQAKPGADKVKVPKQFAGFLGLDPDQEYTLKEIVDLLKGMGIGGGMEITEEMVAMFLGMGPAVTIDRLDQPVLDAVQKDYKDGLKAAKLEYPEKRAKGVGRGSFAAFAYFQYGVPVFSADVWGVPEPKKEEPKDALTADKLRTMTSDEFVALGEDKIDAFLKAQGAPPNLKAAALIGMVKGGQVTPAKMAEMMDKMPKKPGAEGEDNPEAYLIRYSDTVLGGKGFVNWTPVKHPTLGDVEVGGFVPFLKIDPVTSEAKAWVDFQADFFLKLMSRMPNLELGEAKVKPLGEGLYDVDLYLTNTGWLPTSTAQGRRARRAWPIRVTLKMGEGQALVAGRPIENVPVLNGSGEVKKLTWTLRAKKGSKVAFTAWSPRLGTLEKTVSLD
jgi:hypothetical protein